MKIQFILTTYSGKEKEVGLVHFIHVLFMFKMYMYEACAKITLVWADIESLLRVQQDILHE